jgi:arsenate reductase
MVHGHHARPYESPPSLAAGGGSGPTRWLAEGPPSRASIQPFQCVAPRTAEMTDPMFNVLFLCTGNSARSILAERLIERWGQGRFRGFSAGSHPKGEVHPFALELLQRNNFSIEGLRSKDWAEFAAPGAPKMDFVFTVCDNAAAEVCPVWPGQPMSAHWGVADPAAVEGDEVTRLTAFRTALRELENRIKIFVALPFASLDRLKLQQKLDEIGQTTLGDA